MSYRNDIDDIIRQTAERKRREIVEESYEAATERITEYFYEASGIHVHNCSNEHIARPIDKWISAMKHPEKNITIDEMTDLVEIYFSILEGDWFQLNCSDIERIFDSLENLGIIKCKCTDRSRPVKYWWYELA